MDNRFRTTAIVTTDGKVLSGFLGQQSNDEVTLITPEEQPYTLPRSKIDEMGAQTTSPMRVGLLRYLDTREINDLLAYLREL